MSGQGWWLGAPNPQLEQGDVFGDIPFIFTVAPIQPLIGETIKGNRQVWAPRPVTDQVGGSSSSYLSNGRRSAGLLLNHGCDIDKGHNRRLSFAAVGPISALPKEHQGPVITQQTAAMLYLPDLPGIGDAYADLRILACVPSELAERDKRVASMSPEAIVRLQAQIVTFFLRKEL